MGINPKHYFVLKSGESIKSLDELILVLNNIDKETFEFHVTNDKNDFANWIRFVFKAPKLAETISDGNYANRKAMIAAIKKFLNEKKILVINAGSSSLKFKLIELVSKDCIFSGVIDAINQSNCSITVNLNDGSTNKQKVLVENHEDALKLLIKSLFEQEIIGDISEIKGIGHRVVHGGETYTVPVVIDDAVIEELQNISSLAPLHNPPNIACILACKNVLNIPQVAVFDTAFHSTIGKEKYLYGLPYEYYEKYHIRKYGFHGTSHKYITNLMIEYYKIKKKKKPNLLICHLGNGSSITAVKNGKSFNTSMGFTPTDGLIMGTRSGSLDPYIAVHLEKIFKIGYEELGNILNKQSGLVGICGYSDMRLIWKNKRDKKCRLAIDMYADRITHFIGAYLAEMDTVDGIVFTAGIGENAFYIRKKVLDNFKHVGIKLDNRKNEKNDFIISRNDSTIECFVIKTNEELQIAQETRKVLKI
jgi:acetate kinase